MRRHLILLSAAAMALTALAAKAGPAQDAIIAHYAELAKAADPAFTAFSAKDGEAFFQANHTGGGADTPSCTTCHTADPRAVGKTRVGKAIEPMALSASPDRYSDPAKFEKWIGRNCNSVLGRDCTTKEIGDVVTYLTSL